MSIHSPIPTTGNRLFDEAELLVTSSAASLQISARLHQQAETNYTAIADYIDSSGSPLAGRVIGIVASGSFAIGATILGKTKSTQHDVDAVLILKGAYLAHPKAIIDDVFKALVRPGSDEPSRYQGKVTRNSRCVTVTYEDGRTVDIMPVCEYQINQSKDDERHYLFHYKAEQGKPVESYHKPVRPKGFIRWYRGEDSQLIESPKGFVFAEAFRKSVRDHQLVTAKAETEPFPNEEKITEKSLRTLVVQLMKRNRHIGQRLGRLKKCPPSVIIATMAMQTGRDMRSLLIDELITVAGAVLNVWRTISGLERRWISITLLGIR